MRRLLLSLGVLLIAAAVAVGSGANFNATSANPGNIIKAGVVSVSNSKSASAIMSTTAMAPGDSKTDTVDIVNTGDLAATFKLAASSVVDTPASPALSAKLTLKVVDAGDPSCSSSCPADVTVYEGKLGSLGTVTAGTWAAGSKHRVKFTVAFPDGGSGADNSYKSAKTTLDLTWSATG